MMIRAGLGETPVNPFQLYSACGSSSDWETVYYPSVNKCYTYCRLMPEYNFEVDCPKPQKVTVTDKAPLLEYQYSDLSHYTIGNTQPYSIAVESTPEDVEYAYYDLSYYGLPETVEYVYADLNYGLKLPSYRPLQLPYYQSRTYTAGGSRSGSAVGGGGGSAVGGGGGSAVGGGGGSGTSWGDPLTGQRMPSITRAGSAPAPREQGSGGVLALVAAGIAGLVLAMRS